MSIYGTLLQFAGDDHDVEHCDAYYESTEGCWDFTGRECTCDAWKMQPIVYEGSHILPADTDRRGGWIEVAMIPDHITRDGRDDSPEGDPKPWLRIGLGSDDSTEQYQGKPYVRGGDATVVLTREMAVRLRDVLEDWLTVEVPAITKAKD